MRTKTPQVKPATRDYPNGVEYENEIKGERRMCTASLTMIICKSGRCSTVLRRGGTLWNAWNTCPVPEQCGMVWNGMEWVCLDNTCHPLSPPVNPRNGKILNWS